MKNVLSIALTLLFVTTRVCSMTTETPDSPRTQTRKGVEKIISILEGLEGADGARFLQAERELNPMGHFLDRAIDAYPLHEEVLKKWERLYQLRKAEAKKTITQIDRLYDHVSESAKEEKKS